MDEVFNMSQQEINKHHVIRSVLEHKATQAEAAQVLKLGTRQIKRLCAGVKVRGARAVIHGLRGRPSNNCLDEELLSQVLSTLHDPLWEGFGPVFAKDKLKEYHGIVLSKETLRQVMRAAGLWQRRRRGNPHRSRRERRISVGMLVQLDGSDHDWFEGRGPRCVLLAYIDDATSRILYAEFVKVEDTLTLMRGTWNYFKRWGRPVAWYVDRDSIYKVNLSTDYEGRFRDEKPITQFTRAMEELGIKVICANTPQAKGRVERTFKTHQDRLVKELRLRHISTIAEANRYLWREYIPGHNARFAVAAACGGDLHRPLLKTQKLEEILSMRTERTVGSDYVISYEKQLIQILKHQQVRIDPRDKVQVEIRLDGSTHLRFKDVYLNFKRIAKRPYRPLLVAQPSRDRIYDDPRTTGVGSKPGKNHPWRRLFLHGPHRVGLPAKTTNAL